MYALGGNNAGHTVIVGEDKFELHLIPSGYIVSRKTEYNRKWCRGRSEALVQEMKMLEEKGVSLDNLYISEIAHVIMPIIESSIRQRKGVKEPGK